MCALMTGLGEVGGPLFVLLPSKKHLSLLPGCHSVLMAETARFLTGSGQDLLLSGGTLGLL